MRSLWRMWWIYLSVAIPWIKNSNWTQTLHKYNYKTCLIPLQGSLYIYMCVSRVSLLSPCHAEQHHDYVFPRLPLSSRSVPVTAAVSSAELMCVCARDRGRSSAFFSFFFPSKVSLCFQFFLSLQLLCCNTFKIQWCALHLFFLFFQRKTDLIDRMGVGFLKAENSCGVDKNSGGKTVLQRDLVKWSQVRFHSVLLEMTLTDFDWEVWMGTYSRVPCAAPWCVAAYCTGPSPAHTRWSRWTSRTHTRVPPAMGIPLSCKCTRPWWSPSGHARTRRRSRTASPCILPDRKETMRSY